MTEVKPSLIWLLKSVIKNEVVYVVVRSFSEIFGFILIVVSTFNQTRNSE